MLTSENKSNKGKGFKDWEDFGKDIALLWKNHEKLKPENYEIAVSSTKTFFIDNFNNSWYF